MKSEDKDLFRQVEESKSHLSSIFGEDVDTVIADRRYGVISAIFRSCARKIGEERLTLSDKIDKIVLNKILGIPIFLTIIWLVFKFTFTFSEPLSNLIEKGQEILAGFFSSILPKGSLISSLVVDGIIGGVGSVLVFVPIIFLLFFALSILEDSGYMARAAFVMDRVMNKIGLCGKSFIPMILGFGCNLPAIMATRTIESKRDRFVTILSTPFISCGARLPVYTLFIGCFFARHGATVLFSIYLFGIGVAIVSAKLFRKYLFPGPPSPFLMELPPYRVPTLKGLFIHMWERGVVYLKKAGTIIFLACVVVWFLSNFPWNVKYEKDYEALLAKEEKVFLQKVSPILAQLGFNNKEELERSKIYAEFKEGKEIEESKKELISKYEEFKKEFSDKTFRIEAQKLEEKLSKSYAGRIGKAIAPIFRPNGFADWKIGVGLLGGFVAKEIVVGTLGTLYGVGEASEESESLRDAIRDATYPDGRKIYTPLSAYALMIFVLLYVPCVATIAVIYRETNSIKWPIFSALYTTFVAWFLSLLVYQGGRIIGLS